MWNVAIKAVYTMVSEFDVIFASIAPEYVSLFFVTVSCYV
jgi:hypothetical protein